MGDFASEIMQLRYSWDLGSHKESWEEISTRVVDNVVGNKVNLDTKNEILNYIKTRKFIPGGRFLAQSGREYHQTNNCFLLRAEDSREGWGELTNKATVMLMSGGGIGVDYSQLRPNGYPLKRSGGFSSGAIPIAKTINEIGRGVMSGGKRRSAIWAGLNWKHEDVDDFIVLKNWTKEIRDLKEKDYDFPATMDMTNISVILDREFFDAYNDHENHLHQRATDIYWKVIKRMLKTGEPGFSINYDNKNESLRNACFTSDMHLLTENGYLDFGSLNGKEITILDKLGNKSKSKVWKSGNKSVIELNLSTNKKIKCTPDHILMTISGENISANESKGNQLMPFIFNPSHIKEFIAYGFMQGDGNLTRLKSESHKGIEVNIGKNDSDLLEYFNNYHFVGDRVIYVSDVKDNLINLQFSSEKLPERIFPNTYLNWTISEKAAFLSGCYSANGSINNYARVCYKSTCKEFILQLKQTLFDDFGIDSYITTNKSHPIEFSNGTYIVKESYDLNISSFDDKILFFNNIGFIQEYKREKLLSQIFETAPFVKSIKEIGNQDVYDFTEPNTHWGIVEGFIVHNCTEVVSEDDSDVCCLGSINLANIENKTELKAVTELGQLFLLLGTEYSDFPFPKIREVRNSNRRTGLGLMGIHEWLIKNGLKYEFNDKLSEYLQIWKDTSDYSAKVWCNTLGFKESVAKRAIAPNGTISIAGGKTTSGIEPIFSVAYQRRYLTPEGWKKQYVIDSVAEKLVESGIKPEDIEDAYSLSFDIERRIKFQSEIQKYVDNSISSTINLPSFGESGNDNIEEFGNILYKYLPSLRGITVYPNNARSGQPLIPVDYNYAIDKKNVVFEGNEDCVEGVCGL